MLLVSFGGTALGQEVTESHEVRKPDQGDMEVGIFLGGFINNYYHQFYDPSIPNREELDAVSPDFGLRFAYFPDAHIGIEGEGSLVLSNTKMSQQSVRLFGLHAQIVLQYPAVVTPFVTAGFGMIATNSSQDAEGNDADFPLHVGVGARYFFTNSVAVRADARFLRGPSSKSPYTLDASYGEFMIGLTFRPDLKTSSLPPPDPDPDNDGVMGEADKCPDVAGFTADGCPIKDTDGDTILDPDDKCPNEPETVNNWQDDDGCPDEIPDTDGDGLKDPVDRCKDAAEDKDGFEDDDGCPDPDNDNDGLVDGADKCPDQKGPPANNGCPDTDQDNDGVVDRLDNCPTVAGTQENHGCVAKQRVVLTKDQLKILDRVLFRTGSARLRSRSHALLDNIAKVMQAHPEIKKVKVEGYTDSRGSDAKNLKLSQDRAASVVSYLVSKGVDADRLEPIGHGEEDPIADNGTRTGRRANRRVEFNIVNEPVNDATTPAPQGNGAGGSGSLN